MNNLVVNCMSYKYLVPYIASIVEMCYGIVNIKDKL